MTSTSRTPRYDLLIVGAGITGVFAAMAGYKRGLSVALVDQALSPGMGSTFTSGGSLGLLDKTTLQLGGQALESMEIYRSTSKLIEAEDLISWCGGYVPYFDDTEEQGCLKIAEVVEQLGVKVDCVDGKVLRQRVPFLSGDLSGATVCGSEGRVRPHDFCTVLFSYLKDRNAFDWFGGHRVVELNLADEVEIACEQRSGERVVLSSSFCLIAVGSYAASLGDAIPGDVQPRRGLVVSVDPVSDLDVVMHGAGYLGARDECDPGSLSCGFAFEPRGPVWRLGSSRELVGWSTDGTEKVANAILDDAHRYIPGLNQSRIRRIDVCWRPFDRTGEEEMVRAVGGSRIAKAITAQEGEGITLAPYLADRVVSGFVGDD